MASTVETEAFDVGVSILRSAKDEKKRFSQGEKPLVGTNYGRRAISKR